MNGSVIITSGTLALAAAGLPASAAAQQYSSPPQRVMHVFNPALSTPTRVCEPGKVNIGTGCVFPRQMKMMLHAGQQLPTNYTALRSYKALPYEVRSFYGAQLDPSSRYVYDRFYVYRVDPQSLIVEEVFSAPGE